MYTISEGCILMLYCNHRIIVIIIFPALLLSRQITICFKAEEPLHQSTLCLNPSVYPIICLYIEGTLLSQKGAFLDQENTSLQYKRNCPPLHLSLLSIKIPLPLIQNDALSQKKTSLILVNKSHFL